jgi:transcriptional regulator with XRE-family HTH domain
MTFDPSALKRLRKATGWGLHRLAVELAREGIVDSITAETIRKFELGITEPRVSLFFAISRVLNVPAASLLRQRGPRAL